MSIMLELIAALMLTTQIPDQAFLSSKQCTLQLGYAQVHDILFIPLINPSDYRNFALLKTPYGQGAVDITEKSYPISLGDPFEVLYRICTDDTQKNPEVDILQIVPVRTRL